MTVNSIRGSMYSFAGVERKFFEKGIRIDRKPVPIHPKRWIDVNFIFRIYSEYNKASNLFSGLVKA